MTMTVEELYAMLGEMIEDGLGNYTINVTDFEDNAYPVSGVRTWEAGNVVWIGFR